MSNQDDATDEILRLRRLTRAISDVVRERMQGYLMTLSPLLRPKRIFGEHVQGSATDTPRSTDAAVKELTGLHERIAGAKPFGLRTPLTLPIRLASSALEITPLEYSYTAGGDAGRRVTIRSPLKWVVSYSGSTPGRLKELLASRQRSAEELHEHLLNYLVLHVVFSQQTGTTDILSALHFPVTTERIEEFGDLPVTCIGCAVATTRPPDEVIERSVEISGMDAFEEVVRLEDVTALRDPLQEALRHVVAAHTD